MARINEVLSHKSVVKEELYRSILQIEIPPARNSGNQVDILRKLRHGMVSVVGIQLKVFHHHLVVGPIVWNRIKAGDRRHYIAVKQLRKSVTTRRIACAIKAEEAERPAKSSAAVWVKSLTP